MRRHNILWKARDAEAPAKHAEAAAKPKAPAKPKDRWQRKVVKIQVEADGSQPAAAVAAAAAETAGDAAGDEPPGLPLEQTAAAAGTVETFDDSVSEAGESATSSANTSVCGDSEGGPEDMEDTSGDHRGVLVQCKDRVRYAERVSRGPCSSRAERDDAGNVGYIFLNNGLRAKNASIKAHF